MNAEQLETVVLGELRTAVGTKLLEKRPCDEEYYDWFCAIAIPIFTRTAGHLVDFWSSGPKDDERRAVAVDILKRGGLLEAGIRDEYVWQIPVLARLISLKTTRLSCDLLRLSVLDRSSGVLSAPHRRFEFDAKAVDDAHD